MSSRLIKTGGKFRGTKGIKVNHNPRKVKGSMAREEAQHKQQYNGDRIRLGRKSEK